MLHDRKQVVPYVMETEETFVKTFIAQDCQLKWILKLSQRRQKEGKALEKISNWLSFRLNHQPDLNPSFILNAPSNQQHSSDIESRLFSMGAPEVCHVISSSLELDDREIPLHEALDKVVGKSCLGTFIICLPDRLAFWQGEERKRYILFRK